MLLVALVGFYLLAFLGARGVSAGRVFAWPWSFSLVNAASGLAFARFLRGEKQVIWRPREGA